MFPNLIHWWETMVKPQVKTFYIHQGKEQKKLEQGLLNYYEIKLRTLYDQANNEHILDFVMIKELNNKIDSYREKAVEGIRIRSRVQDAICGEKISRYLIAKQKDISQKKIITKMADDDGSILTSFAPIQKHAVKFYKNLYSKCTVDHDKQVFFLSFLRNELSDDDRNHLCTPLSTDEIYKTIKLMALNKTPGIDGLPVEFYIEHWELIANDILALYDTILDTGYLGKSQKRGVITIIPKSNNTLDIRNYRPISLLCTDYNILSKIFAERIKAVLCKVINNKQFCGIPGRSINQCNMELRDLIQYANDSNLNMAVLNLDWYKAFDLVPVDFVFKVLQTLGFGDIFILLLEVH